jgi:hypothetical protein
MIRQSERKFWKNMKPNSDRPSLMLFSSTSLIHLPYNITLNKYRSILHLVVAARLNPLLPPILSSFHPSITFWVVSASYKTRKLWGLVPQLFSRLGFKPWALQRRSNYALKQQNLIWRSWHRELKSSLSRLDTTRKFDFSQQPAG